MLKFKYGQNPYQKSQSQGVSKGGGAYFGQTNTYARSMSIDT